MGVALRVRSGLAVVLVGLPLWVGCGETIETGPAVEPNKGPEMPPGGGKTELKAPTFPASGKGRETRGEQK